MGRTEGAAKAVTEEQHDKERLFSDISVAQVLATALAAVTSMLLSSYIGIAGSVIGVAVASVVSTLAASAYKKFLRDSAEKIKELPLPVVHPGASKTHASANEHPTGEAEREDAAGTAAEDTPATNNVSADEPDEVPRSEGTDATPSEAAADEVRKKRLMRGLIAVCVVSALLAVAASGAVVYLLTTGEGLGAKPTSLYMATSSSTDSRSDRGATASTGQNSAEDEGGTDIASTNASSSASSGSAASSSASGASSSSDSASSSASASASSSGSSSSDAASSSSDTADGNSSGAVSSMSTAASA